MVDLPGYLLTATVFEGAVHILLEGQRREDGLLVVLKVLRDEHASPLALARLRHEHAVLRELDVPGVVRTLGLERTDRGPVLVLERLPGASLRDLVKKGAIEIPLALRIARALALTLDGVHAKGVLHKDVKPSNVVFDPASGAVTLVDFGLASRIPRETQALSATPEALEGTLAYMAPEQTGRMNRVVDARSDLYALGATLFELLTGVPPFPETDPLLLVHAHVARTPPRPSALRTAVPEAVSDVVLKLLAKSAEDRYQTGAGLAADLEVCLAELSAQGTVAPFALGRRDARRELVLPQRLYGRERELAALEDAFTRAAAGDTRAVILRGPAGIGKSALVREMFCVVARRGGMYGAGKAEPDGNDIPHAPLAQALREVMRSVLGLPPAALARMRARLESTLGEHARLLEGLIPELSPALGLGAVSTSPRPEGSRERFPLLLHRFVRALCEEAPLVLFLDDLQWADPDTVNLFARLVDGPKGARLMLVGAHRDDEVGADHPLARALRSLATGGASITEIDLGPLPFASVTELLADTLAAPAEEVAELGALLSVKTHDNPFFLGRFLRAMADEGAIRFDAEAMRFVWDRERIAQAESTENVVVFLSRKLAELPARTQRALTLAACIGHVFDLGTLSAIAGTTPEEAAAALHEALVEGLVWPLDARYRYAEDPREPGAEEAPEAAYRFAHDRVEQAARERLTEAEHAEVHLAIGRRLAARFAGDAPGEALLDVVHHLNLGRARMQDAAERMRLARWDLLAARRVKARGAYDAAAALLAAASELGEGDGALGREILAEQAECDALRGRMEAAEAAYGELLRTAATPLEKARLSAARADALCVAGRFVEAIEAGREGLAALSVTLPRSAEEIDAAMREGFSLVHDSLGGRPVESLLEAPLMTDPRDRAVLRLFTEIWAGAHFGQPALRNVLTLRHVDFSLRHGHSEDSAFGYAAHCTSLRVLGRYEEARAFGRLSLVLGRRLQNPALWPRILVLYASNAHYFEPLRRVPSYLDEAREAALAEGDPSYTSYAMSTVVPQWIALDREIPEVLRDVEAFVAVVTKRTRDELSGAFLRAARQVLSNLLGRTRGRDTLDDGLVSEAELLAALARPGFAYAACWVHSMRLSLAYLYGDHVTALERAREAEARLESARGTYLSTELSFFGGLAAAARLHEAEGDEAAGLWEDFDRREAELSAWAQHCPDNYAGRLSLLLAERAWLSGQDAKAEALYDAAIEALSASGFLRDTGVASERAGLFWLSRGRRRIARAYLGDARGAFRRWGAMAKVAAMDEAHGKLLGPLEQARPSPSATSTADTETATATQHAHGALDVLSVVRSAQAIAEEIVMERAQARLLRIILTNAGARRGVLLLARGGRLSIEATVTAQPDEVQRGSGASLAEAGAELPVVIAQYVERTRAAIVIDDALAEPRWSADAYVTSRRPRSILCLPLLHQGRLSGIIYLENDVAAGVFTKARLSVCQMLSAQAAIALENALLYGHLEEVMEAMRAQNDRLEEEVARRTSELRATLAERVRAEEARAALSAEIIRAQEERLAELMTPLIPLSSRVLVMPLLGTIDAARAEQILETALAGVSARGASALIMDVTGVRTVDAQVAATLLRTASALRLLGAEVVITGIRGEVAHTLVQLGADLSSVVTRATLESGIAHALGRTQRRGAS